MMAQEKTEKKRRISRTNWTIRLASSIKLMIFMAAPQKEHTRLEMSNHPGLLTIKRLKNKFLLTRKRRARITLHRERLFQPAQVLAISFVAAILLGALLLWLPFCTTSGRISFIDALFTSTSAVCVTGLVVVDTATYFTITGKWIILLLIQLGGLGVMTLPAMVLLAAGRSITISARILVQEGYQHGSPRDFRALIKSG